LDAEDAILKNCAARLHPEPLSLEIVWPALQQYCDAKDLEGQNGPWRFAASDKQRSQLEAILELRLRSKELMMEFIPANDGLGTDAARGRNR
jgi:hypothetical protein